VILGPTVWTDVLNLGDAIFPYKNPALFSMTISFLGIWHRFADGQQRQR
jgi:cation/acetate symporter